MAGVTSVMGVGVTVTLMSSAQSNDEHARYVTSSLTPHTPPLVAVRAVVHATSTIDDAAACLGNVCVCVHRGDVVGVMMRSLSVGFWGDVDTLTLGLN